MKKSYKTYVGADLHKAFTQFNAMSRTGKELAERRLDNSGETFRAFLSQFPKPVLVVVESTSNWAWFSDEVRAGGHEVLVAHAKETSAMSGTREHNDRRDARMLASLARGGMISKQCWQAPREILCARERLRFMRFLTRQKVACKNRIHSVLIRLNLNCPRKDPFCKSGRLWLRNIPAPESYRQTIASCLSMIECAESMLEEAMLWCADLAREDEMVGLLRSMPGVNTYLAAMIRFETGDIQRFDRVEQFTSYTGLAPCKWQSAEREHSMGISKEGSFWLRWAFVQASQNIPRTRGRLSRFYWRHAHKTNCSNKAKVATAREMARIAFYMMKRRQGYYEPLPLTVKPED